MSTSIITSLSLITSLNAPKRKLLGSQDENYGARIPQDEIISSLRLATLFPEAIEASLISQISGIIYGVNNQKWDSLQTNEVLPISKNIMNSILYHSLSEPNETNAVFYTSDYINEVTEIERIYELILNKYAKSKIIIANNITIPFGSFNAYIFKKGKEICAFSSSSFTTKISNVNAFGIEYPYALSRNFLAPPKYRIGSAALGVILYGEARVGKIKDANIDMTFDISPIYVYEKYNTSEDKLLDDMSMACVCYSRDSMLIVCGIANKVDNTHASCSCYSEYSPCFLAYKMKVKRTILIISIVIPITVITAGIIAATIGIILWRRKRRLDIPSQSTVPASGKVQKCITHKHYREKEDIITRIDK